MKMTQKEADAAYIELNTVSIEDLDLSRYGGPRALRIYVYGACFANEPAKVNDDTFAALTRMCTQENINPTSVTRQSNVDIPVSIWEEFPAVPLWPQLIEDGELVAKNLAIVKLAPQKLGMLKKRRRVIVPRPSEFSDGFVAFMTNPQRKLDAKVAALYRRVRR